MFSSLAFWGHAQVHPAVKGLMLAWQQMEHPHMSDAENGLIQTAYIHWHTKSPRQKSSRRMR